MNVEQLITHFWGQIAVILTAIGFIIKNILDSFYKKKELKYSFFYSKRIDALLNFIDAYVDYDRFFYDIPIYRIKRRELTTMEVDDMEAPYRETFTRALNRIKLFSSKHELKIILQLKDLITSSHQEVSNVMLDNGDVNKYGGLVITNREKSDRLLLELSECVRKEFI